MKDFWNVVKICGIISVLLDPVGGTIGCLYTQHLLKESGTDEVTE